MPDAQAQNESSDAVSLDEVDSMLDASEGGTDAPQSVEPRVGDERRGDGAGSVGAEERGAGAPESGIATSDRRASAPESGAQSEAQGETQRYDFRHTSFLSGHAFRKLRLRQEEFVNSLASRLSMYLRIEFNLKLLDLKTQTYGKFIDELSDPTHITLFKIDPLRGIGLLEIHPALGRTIVDRLLGGAAEAGESERPMSELEVSLLDQIIGFILNEWCGQWAEEQSLKPVIIGHETNGSYLQSATPETMLLVLKLQGKIAETTETLQVVVPCYSLERLTQELLHDPGESSRIDLSKDGEMPEWNSRFDDMKIRISAELPPVKMSARELGQMSLGDTIELDAGHANQVSVRFGGKAKYVGRLGRVGNKRVVQLLSKNIE